MTDLQNRFVKRPLHKGAKATDDQILLAYRQRQDLDEDISEIIKKKADIVTNGLGITIQAFNIRVNTLKKEGYIED